MELQYVEIYFTFPNERNKFVCIIELPTIFTFEKVLSIPRPKEYENQETEYILFMDMYYNGIKIQSNDSCETLNIQNGDSIYCYMMGNL